VTDRPPYRLPTDAVPLHYRLNFEPDLAAAMFKGDADVDLEVTGGAAEVVFNAADLDISEARLSDPSGRDVPAELSYRPGEEQVALVPAEPLAPGPWRLRLRFSGKLNDLLRGFYRSRYKLPDGTEGWVAATQFESTDARRAFPCWDEPELKATFAISIVADDALTVLSNAREVSSEPLGGGKRRVSFAPTIKMSTYLVAMVIGPFELTEAIDVSGTPLRIGFVPGRGDLVGTARACASHALKFFADYFGIPYPADKLDHVAIPDFAAGAMENLGLVTYRETALLVGDDAAQVELQRVAATVAHETAHMWFGDLVTMRWWEGIWLNEAFATFMELLAIDDFEPRWQVWVNFGVDRAAALATDSLRETRAIEYPVGRPEEAEDMFDVITYDKGGSVLRMIERYLGDEVFRSGLHLYLDKHRFANTATTDLWDALEVASSLPVRTAMSTWVDQPGHPLVTIELSGPTSLKLSQKRFLLDGGPPGDQRWVVPVTLRYATKAGAPQHAQLLLDTPSTTVELTGEPEWAVLNEHAWGVYRSHYSDELRGRLFEALDNLDERERLSLVNDLWALAVAGEVQIESSLDLWQRLAAEPGAERGPDVWWAISSALGLLDIVGDEEARQGLRRLTGKLAKDLFSSVGWEPEEGEAHRLARLRARLVSLLGTLGDDGDVQAEAHRRMTAAASGSTALPADLATAVAQVVAAAGGAAEWDLLYSCYENARTPQDEVRYLQALAGFSVPELLGRSIELLFSDKVRSQDAPYALMGALGRREGAALAWQAIEEHWDEMRERWPSSTIHRMLDALPALASASDDMVARANSWLDEHPLARGERKVAQARERLAINVAFKKRAHPRLAASLDAALTGGL